MPNGISCSIYTFQLGSHLGVSSGNGFGAEPELTIKCNNFSPIGKSGVRSIGKSGFRFSKSKSGFPNRTHPGFSDRSKVVAFDRKLRFGAEPVARRDTKMAAELKCVNGTRNSVRNVPTGKTGLPFRFSTYSGNFPVGRADETFSTYCRTEISGNFDEMQSALDLRRSFPDRPSDPNFALSPGFSHKAKIKMAAICLISGGFLVACCLV